MNQNVVAVPITEANNIADHAPDGIGLDKINARLVPQIGS